jgi:CheY-like chemotaxis protein
MFSGDELAFNILKSVRKQLLLLSNVSVDIINECDLALEAVGTSLALSEYMKLSINRCLDISKVHFHDLQLAAHCETVDFSDCIQLPRRVISAVYPDQSVNFAPIPEEICSHIITDRQWFQENLLCFASNAAKYSPAHSCITFTISLVSESKISPPKVTAQPHSSDKTASAQMIMVECEDNGIGMSEEALAALFSPFQQAQKMAGGTGLGLYSMSNRMKALNGHCGVGSRTDGCTGSIFWFAFPYRPDEDAARFHRDEYVHPIQNFSKDSVPYQQLRKLSSAINLTVDVSRILYSASTTEDELAPIINSKTPVHSWRKEPSPILKHRAGDISPSALNLKTHLIEQQMLMREQMYLKKKQDSASKLFEEPNELALQQQQQQQQQQPLLQQYQPFSLLTRSREPSSSALPPIMRSRQPSLSSSGESSPNSTLTVVDGGGMSGGGGGGGGVYGKMQQGCSLLLVEDTMSIRKLTTQLLEREGFTVTTANNGVEALEALGKGRFDAVLMDLNMPVMDGVEAVRRYRALEAEQEKELQAMQRSKEDGGKRAEENFVRTLIFALSANSIEGLDKEVKQVGFDDFLEKPLNVKRFQAILNLTSGENRPW